MTGHDRLAEALRALAREDGVLEAGPQVEVRLIAAFRRNRAQRRWRIVAMAGLAAGVILAAVLIARPDGAHPDRTEPQKIEWVEAPQPAREAVVEAPVTPVVRAPGRAAARLTVTPKSEREIVTEFFPLVETAPPLESGELLRVVVPASTMRAVGLPVREDRWTEPVQADIVIGQEGIARAIRFVGFEPRP